MLSHTYGIAPFFKGVEKCGHNFGAQQILTLYCVDLQYSSKYRYLCVLSFDITFYFFIDITIAKLSATKVRFLKNLEVSLLSKDRYLSTMKCMLFKIYMWVYRGGPVLWLF